MKHYLVLLLLTTDVVDRVGLVSVVLILYSNYDNGSLIKSLLNLWVDCVVDASFERSIFNSMRSDFLVFSLWQLLYWSSSASILPRMLPLEILLFKSIYLRESAPLTPDEIYLFSNFPVLMLYNFPYRELPCLSNLAIAFTYLFLLP